MPLFSEYTSMLWSAHPRIARLLKYCSPPYSPHDGYSALTRSTHCNLEGEAYPTLVCLFFS